MARQYKEQRRKQQSSIMTHHDQKKKATRYLIAVFGFVPEVFFFCLPPWRPYRGHGSACSTAAAMHGWTHESLWWVHGARSGGQVSEDDFEHALKVLPDGAVVLAGTVHLHPFSPDIHEYRYSSINSSCGGRWR